MLLSDQSTEATEPLQNVSGSAKSTTCATRVYSERAVMVRKEHLQAPPGIQQCKLVKAHIRAVLAVAQLEGHSLCATSEPKQHHEAQSCSCARV